MAPLDWSQCSAVESIPGKVGSAWVFTNSRMPVSTVFENFQSGATISDLIAWFGVTEDQVIEVLEFVARSLDPPTHSIKKMDELVDAHSV